MAAANSGQLRPRQRRAISALLSAPTLKDAAERAGIGERTLRRWLQDAAFREALHRAQDETLAQAARQSLAAMGEALATLQGIMADPLAQPTARVSAARAVLEHAARLYEIVNLSERVALLEVTILKGGQAS